MQLAKQVTLVAEVDAHAGAVKGDRVQLLQVLLNLTLNAFEALSVVRVDVRVVTIRADRAHDGKICVSVRDSGPGFPAALRISFSSHFSSTEDGGNRDGIGDREKHH